MKILLHYDIFKEYAKSFGSIAKTNAQKVLAQILENDENNILISEFMLTCIENSIGVDDNALDVFKQCMLHWNYSGRVISIVTSSCDCRDAFQQAASLNQHHLGICQNISDMPSRLKFVSLDSINSITIDRALVYAAALSPNAIVIRYSDFSNDLDIKYFFDEYFNVFETQDVSIYDRYFNIDRHDYLNNANKCKVVCYTVRATTRKSLIRMTNINLKLSSSLSLNVYEAEPQYIHERKIFIGSFVLSTDEDFANMSTARPTWDIKISYDENMSSSWTSKSSYFTQTL